MVKTTITELKAFCARALEKEGMCSKHAKICAEVLSETDAFGTHSHGTKNLHNYIKKIRAGGASPIAEPELIVDGLSVGVIDGKSSLGMVSSYIAMEQACKKAEGSGIALATVRNSCHFGAAGYYANMAAQKGFIGLAMSNVDPNMTVLGARGMIIGNNPLAYAVPARSQPSVFLDIALSNVASLKVVQAKKDGRSIPNTWIVDKSGKPTTDPGRYPEEGAMQPMAAHKGYGLAVLVDVLTAAISGGDASMLGNIVSWCFDLERPNRVCHTFIAINPVLFGIKNLADRMEEMSSALRDAPKAEGCDRIYLPGEIEWAQHRKAETEGLELPNDVYDSLCGLAKELNMTLPFGDVI